MKTCPTCMQPIPFPKDEIPCKACQIGWAVYQDAEPKVKHCSDTCVALKNYMEENRSK